MNQDQFREALLTKGFTLTDEQMNQFEKYYELLVDWNERMNLTSITDKEEVYLKHFYDSISVAFYHDFNKEFKLVDVGAGAGFPSIPLKICFPELHVTIVDSLNKRISFLNALAAELNLSNVSFYHERAENFGLLKEHREKYDIVLARAVARLPVLLELCLPLTKVGGRFIAMKAAGAQEELKDSNKALNLLGGVISSDSSFKLPGEESERAIIEIAKEKPTPKKYPRKAGTPNKQPLV
ncbi:MULTISPECIES: 16S rRNA (guanine(527)-N(7))-methyltransferase RsmG [Bacillaceae]|uniref:Ribosomal RNA small subunit methyltransferase G n=1 Tax=Evansella alkalicola TaxID=745819 RepID=A0ABS6JV71_9BACI|nr:MULTISPECIES: 16S rRNA (guanine(527)-N(7))-methyltransferase RsmG [Bacillaceae]MBU9722305.1 16S rRNA (guanine(527)-N(7))-methyltransferase RsmG [Bacillus alkalicola]